MTDLLFIHGKIYTQNPAYPRAEAVAVSQGKITAVGSTDELLTLGTSSTKTIDLGGRTLLPGFNDAHIHLWKVGQLRTSVLDVRGVASMDDLLHELQVFCAKQPDGTWVIARGYNEQTMAERRHPTRDDLDAVSTTNPVYVIRTCAHRAVANSVALGIAGIDAQTEDPAGGVIERNEYGTPSGILHETALALVQRCFPETSREQFEEMIDAGAERLLSLGVTHVTDPGVSAAALDAYRALDDAGRLRLRCNVMVLGPGENTVELDAYPEHYASDFLRVDTVKFFADGALSGGTAALRGSYRSHAGQGVLRFDEKAFVARALPFHRQGWRVATHAIGDAAIDTVLNGYQRLYDDCGGKGHRIEHCGLPDAEQIQRMKTMSVAVIPQAIFLRELGEGFRHHLTQEYLRRCYPIGSLMEAGVPLALSTDAPVVVNENPLAGIEAAVTRRDAAGVEIAPNEAISVEEAIEAYTAAGSRISGDDDRCGVLREGMWADLVVLDENPYTCAQEAIGDIKVRSTWVAGGCVYECD